MERKVEEGGSEMDEGEREERGMEREGEGISRGGVKWEEMEEGESEIGRGGGNFPIGKIAWGCY